MADETEKRVDDALARLAREVNAAAPVASPDLTARVMDGATVQAIDTALDRLGQAVTAAAPRPGTDLMARVLADAASVAPVAAQAGVELAPARPRSLVDRLFGWTGGTVAAMSICLTMGVAIGMEMPEDRMPVIGSDSVELAEAEADPMGFLPEDFI